MNVAVLSLTRDRIDYTRHCFGTLLENAGCDFDWFITDQGSEDGTVDWLHANTDATVFSYPENIGICPALNMMIDEALAVGDYDVIVKVDNDCELVTPNTLRDVCRVAGENGLILSPHIHGLREPPRSYAKWGKFEYGAEVSLTRVVGGIFMAVPASLFKEGYRHPINETKDGDDWNLCNRVRHHGGLVGYLDGYDANHYETTDGQHARYPEYFARREAEREQARMVAA